VPSRFSALGRISEPATDTNRWRVNFISERATKLKYQSGHTLH
jgi:hypothetical protein